MRKIINKPKNHQDFELLCRKLAKEIWKCEDIRGNGRNGQRQQGVDISGIPNNSTEYYVIQCKNKTTKTGLKEKEIDGEINSATFFKPILKKLYIFTSAYKDAKIEEYVRLKNNSNTQNNLFEVHLISWEEIEEYLDDYPNIKNWYLTNQSSATDYNARVTFENDQNSLNTTTPFTIHENRYTEKLTNLQSLSKYCNFIYNGPFPTDCSYFDFKIKITNIGILPIEKYKLLINIDGDYTEITKPSNCITMVPMYSNISINGNIVKYTPNSDTLVKDDHSISSSILIKPISDDRPQKFKLTWKLISKTFQKNGELFIFNENIFENKITYTTNMNEISYEIKDKLK